MNDIFVTTLPQDMIDLLKEELLTRGFLITSPPHTIFQGKGNGITCTLYTSLKLTVAGKQKKDFIEFFLEPEIIKKPIFTARKELMLETTDLRPRIGVDEAGKGDYFGPLCVSGVMASKDEIPLLIDLQVQDSKNLSDKQVCFLAKKIVQLLPNYTIKLRPEKYNELYKKFGNLNHLLAWCHATVIDTLAANTNAAVAVIDKFAHESLVIRAMKKKNASILLEQNIKGEADIVVAAASIVARWSFLEGLAETGSPFQRTLPKGAGPSVTAFAKTFVRTHGPEALPKVAKIHFKTTKEIV